MNKMEECNIRSLNKIVELSESDFNNPRSDAMWEEYEKLAKEMDDDDPRMETGYHQYALDARTKDIIRAKAMIAAKNNLAKLSSMLCGVMKGGEIVIK